MFLLSDVTEITSVEEFDAALDDNDTLVVKFWATWCGPCRAFAPHYEAAAERSSDEFVSVDIERVPEIAARYKIQSIPAVLALADDDVRVLTSRKALPLLAELNN